MFTLHVRGKPGEVAPYVLLPGDPGRAEWIAKTYLERPQQYNSYRSLLGFTGTYKGLPVSVQTTGMGTPSAAIVTEELIRLGVKVMVRVGTTGAVHDGLKSADVVVAQGAIPLDGTTRQYLEGRPYAPIPDYDVLQALVDSAKSARVRHQVGLILTEDAFYATTPKIARSWGEWGVLGVEMESSAIFTIARRHGVRAGTLLTVSNQIGDSSFIPPQVLQGGVARMTEVALESLVLLEQRLGVIKQGQKAKRSRVKK